MSQEDGHSENNRALPFLSPSSLLTNEEPESKIADSNLTQEVHPPTPTHTHTHTHTLPPDFCSCTTAAVTCLGVFISADSFLVCPVWQKSFSKSLCAQDPVPLKDVQRKEW
jgi:hypothetical protein